MPKKILIVEDEANIRELLRLYLEREGYTVLEAENGVEGIKKWKSDKPDMLLLDVMMPVMDGWAVCREIRAESDVPIIMLTAKGETADRVSGLEMGADDYSVKPREMPEGIARVRAVFRRMAPDDALEKLSFDNLVIDKQAYDLVIKGKRVDAPPKEIELLSFLASSPNRVFTRAQLLDDVWGFDYFGDTRTVDVHVKRLREKLEGVYQGVSHWQSQVFLQGLCGPPDFDRVRVCTGRRGVLLPDEQLRAACQADRAAHDRAEPCRAEQAARGYGL